MKIKLIFYVRFLYFEGVNRVRQENYFKIILLI